MSCDCNLDDAYEDGYEDGRLSAFDEDDAERAALRARVAELEAELNARKGDPITRLHNIARGLEQPMECGHDLADWCDNCETCGSCRDEKRAALRPRESGKDGG